MQSYVKKKKKVNHDLSISSYPYYQNFDINNTDNHNCFFFLNAVIYSYMTCMICIASGYEKTWSLRRHICEGQHQHMKASNTLKKVIRVQ